MGVAGCAPSLVASSGIGCQGNQRCGETAAVAFGGEVTARGHHHGG
jgi:hypothetical protein